MAVRCGIDLGTTYSAISWYDGYNNRVDTIDLESADGAKTIRSVVYYQGANDAPVVGDTAWNAARHSPERVITGIKRSMGAAYKTAPIDGAEYTPQQVSAEILKTLVKDAQTFLGEEVKDVIITVPAYFGDNERAATEEAGRMAGLNVLGLLPEPHAAALAYSVEKVADITDKYLLVYDLGGGTFDVTLIHAKTESDAGNALNLKIETLCKDGNASLGGLDWDRALAEIVAEKVMQSDGVDVWQDPKNEAVLLDNCEKAKRHLTRTNSVPIVADLANHQAEVTAAEFEDRTRDLLLQTQMLLERVVEDAERQHGIGKDKIEVMLTGGSSRMPMVKRMIEGVMGRPPLQHRNLDLLVTIGAAYWARLLEEGAPVYVPDPDPPDDDKGKMIPMTVGGLTDTALYAVGVEVLRPDGQGKVARFNSVVVPAGARYGEEFEKEFRTAEDNMTEIPVALHKSDADTTDIDQCEPLMTFTITGLPSGRPRGQRVRVKLGYDSSGIIRGTAVDVETDQRADIVVDRNKTTN
ncbi:MAG: Hsp70 family protein [Blastocatellales bacterium]